MPAPGALHRPLMIVSASMVVLCLVALGGFLFDDRTLLGMPIWNKAFKFTISIALYTATLAWMLSLLPKARRWGWWLGTAVAAGLALDMALIVVQMIGRGRMLHFNHADQTDDRIGNLLALGAYTVWLATLVVALLLTFQRLPDKAQASAVRAGLAVALVGMALAMMMFFPTPDQAAALQADQRPAVVGAHSVGVPDGGPGLPVLGWSTTGGDLRVPHFVGIHALQLLPLLAIALSVLSRRFPALRSQFVRRGLIRIAGLGYLALLGLLTWQALRAQSVIHPDGWTLLALAGIVAILSVAGWAVLRSAVGTFAVRPADRTPIRSSSTHE